MSIFIFGYNMYRIILTFGVTITISNSITFLNMRRVLFDCRNIPSPLAIHWLVTVLFTQTKFSTSLNPHSRSAKETTYIVNWDVGHKKKDRVNVMAMEKPRKGQGCPPI